MISPLNVRSMSLGRRGLAPTDDDSCPVAAEMCRSFWFFSRNQFSLYIQLSLLLLSLTHLFHLRSLQSRNTPKPPCLGRLRWMTSLKVDNL